MPSSIHSPRRRARVLSAVPFTAFLLLAACTAAPPSGTPMPADSHAAHSASATVGPASPDPTPEPTPLDARVAEGLAFVQLVNGVEQVFVVDADGSARQVSGHGDMATFGVVRPFWSPDRSMLALRPRSILSGTQPQLMVVNADGTGQRALAQVGENGGWSRDSTRLLYEDSVLTTDTTGEPARIWLLEVASGEATVIGEGNLTQWLADGEHFSYIPVRTGPVVGDTAPIVVRPLAGGEAVQVAMAEDYWWSPDGSALLLQQADGLYLAEPDGSDARHLVAGASGVWSPDGSRIAYAYDITSDAEPIIGVVDRDGEVIWSGQVGTLPTWSPDGTKLAVQVGVVDPSINILDAQTGEVLWQLEGRDPAW